MPFEMLDTGPALTDARIDRLERELGLKLPGGPKEGAVYFWDHDDEHWPATYRNLYLIAETFTKFLDDIHFEGLSEAVANSLVADKAAANAAAGLASTPAGFVWHQDKSRAGISSITMQLVPEGIHRATGHIGPATCARAVGGLLADVAAVPGYLFLRTRNWPSFWVAPILGFAVGAVMGLVLSAAFALLLEQVQPVFRLRLRTLAP